MTTGNPASTLPPLPEPSPLSRILPVLFVLGMLGACVYALTEGTANSRFLQVGATVGALVYLATLVDLVLGLSFLVLAIGLSPEVSLAGVDQLRLEDFIVPPLLLAWMIRAKGSGEKAPPLRLGAPSLALFVLLLLSTLMGVASGLTTAGRALPVLGKYLEYFLIFAVVAKNLRTEREFRTLVWICVAASVLGIVSGALGFGAQRVRGPLGETANIYGGYLSLALSIVLGLGLYATTPGTRALAAAVGLVLAAGIARTFSRTTYVALAASATLFALLKERRLLPLLVFAGLALPFLLPSDVAERVGTIAGVAVGDTPSSWSARLWAWQLAINGMSGGDYLWGRGAGSVALGDIDNEYVRALVDTGFVGLALFLWFLLRTLRTANANFERLPGPGFHKGFAAGYLIAFAAICVHGIGATSFTSIRTMEMFMVLTGLMVCQSGRAVEWGLVPDRAPPPNPANLPLILR